MRLTSLTAVGVTLALLAVTVPAQADFHQDCTGFATAYANTDLSAEPGAYGTELSYEGLVNCPGASVDIHEVTVTPVGAKAIDAVQNEGCEATIEAPYTASGAIADPGPGQYDVAMTFSTPNFPDVERLQRFEWTGMGQPVPVCVHVGFFPVSTGDCPGGPLG